MNIIYEAEQNNLRLISFNPYNQYQLDTLKFYIPKEFKYITPFLVIKDTQGRCDLFKLSLNATDDRYNIYTVALTSSITIKAGKSKVSLFLLTSQNNNFKVSDFSQDINLSYDNYSIGYQLHLIEGLSRNLITAYQKIEQLTQMNIDIHKNIEEAINNDNI